MTTANNSNSSRNRFREKISRPTRPTRLIIAAVLVGLIGLLVVLQLNHFKTQNNQTVSRYLYTYKQLDTYKLVNQNPGSDISFKKPIEFGSKQGSTTKSEQVQLRHPIARNGQFVSIGGIAASSAYMAQPLPPQFLTAITDSMSNTNNPNHKPSLENLTRFINSSLGPRYSSELAVSVKNFRTANIKDNAWVMDFNAVPKKAQDKAVLPNLQGQITFVIGKKSFYHLMVYAEDHNWSNNQKVWTQVLDSIKIDQ